MLRLTAAGAASAPDTRGRRDYLGSVSRVGGSLTRARASRGRRPSLLVVRGLVSRRSPSRRWDFNATMPGGAWTMGESAANMSSLGEDDHWDAFAEVGRSSEGAAHKDRLP